MTYLKQILDFYINSSIHVAMAVTAVTCETFLELNLEPNKVVLAFNFFATITAYNFVKYFGLAKFHHRSLAQWLQIIQVFSAICFLALIYFTLKLSTKVLSFYAVFGLVTFLYAFPFIPKRYLFDSNKNLRSISGIKIYVIASVWMAATVIAPVIASDFEFTLTITIKAIQIFLIVLVWMIPFEIRDMIYDSVKLSTIPQQIGIKASKVLGVILVVIFIVLDFLKTPQFTSMIITVVVGIISILFVLGATKAQNKYYSGLWVEAIPLFWLLLMVIF